MSKKVLLLIPPDPNAIEPFRSAPVRQFPMGLGFPMGIGYVGSYLRERGGYEVRLFDSLKSKASLEEVLNLIGSFQPDYVGMTTFTVNIKVAVQLAKRIKELYPNMIVLAGGPHASDDYSNLLKNYPGFDYIVRGEGEKTALALLQTLDTGERDPRSIRGLAYMHDGDLVATPPALPPDDLDDYPFPARDLLPMDKYIEKETTLPYQVVVQSSRGCTHRCLFCSFQKKWRSRNADSVLAEIRHLIAQYPRMKAISFMDDDFSANRNRVIEFCQKMIQAGLNRYTWSCSCRVDQMDEEMLRWMKQAGCVKILYGLEAADETILKNLRKKIDLRTVERTVELTKSVGIPVIVFVIAGNPGETMETLFKTYNFVKKLPCEAVALGIMQVYPGTGLAKLLPPYDFVSYLYEPEIANPSASIHANVRTFENPGLDREMLKHLQLKLARNIILYKMLHHPVYALRKLWNMPRTAVQNFLWLLGITREPQ